MSTNIFVAGVGGQGTITLKKILSYAAIKEAKFFRSSEIRGLAQRGGSVDVHFRLGEEINSPLIPENEADLIIGLDLLEASRSVKFASSKTVYLMSGQFIAFVQLPNFDKKEFLEIIEPVTKNIFMTDAAKICGEKLGNDVFAGVFLLGFAFAKNLIPFREESLLFGIEKSMPSRFVENNVKAFNLGKEIAGF
jgi:indolepyruvate ferredoxin oxidoreductase beta subunit